MKNDRNHLQARQAFTITEVLIALSLLTIFFAVAGELFKSTILLGFDAPRLSDRASQADSALFQLRRDVWSASRITVPETKSADLESGEEKISWKIESNGDLTRTNNRNPSEEWKGLGEKRSLSSDATSLTINDGTTETRLPSQILITRGSQP